MEDENASTPVNHEAYFIDWAGYDAGVETAEEQASPRIDHTWGKGRDKTRLNHIRHFYVITVACYSYIYRSLHDTI
jgi:hypothetical protein